MNQLNLKDINIIQSIPPRLSRDDRCAIDLEISGMDSKKLHRPNGNFACVTFCFNGKDVYMVTDVKDIPKALKNVDPAVLIFHNAKFDVFHLRRWATFPQRKRLWCTMLIEQVMFSGYYDSFSLADLTRRYLGLYLEKETREEFSDPNARMTKEMIEYAAIDPVVTWRVYQEQKKIICDTDVDIWTEIELPFMWVLLSMPGMALDKDAWIALYKKNRADAQAVQEKYIEFDTKKYTMEQALKAKKYKGINLGSWMQVKQEITRQGYKVDSTGEDDIAPHAEKCEFIRDVLEFRGKSKAASTYGEGWITNGLIESDGRIYSEFRQIGAATGRLSSSSPNVENIPVRETPEFRKCFVAGKGNILIDADWSAQEPRIAAYLSQDEKLIKIFQEKKDVYIEAARLMFGWEMEKKDPRRNGRMKPTVLGASYGLTEYGMEKKYGIPKDEGKMYLDKFFQTFTGMKRYKDHQQQAKDFVSTILGRKYWLNPYKKGSDNNALNSPVQGSAGDALKIAGARFQKCIDDAGYTGKVSIINFIHDEILIEAQKKLKSWTMKTLRQVMLDVAEEIHPNIPADVEVKDGLSWHDAH